MTYKVQIDDTVRDATPDEVAKIESLQSEPTFDEHLEARQTAIKSARAKLAALGLTEAEIKTLLGA